MSYGGKSLPGLPRAALCWTPGLAPAPNVLAPQGAEVLAHIARSFWLTLSAPDKNVQARLEGGTANPGTALASNQQQRRHQ